MVYFAKRNCVERWDTAGQIGDNKADAYAHYI